MEILMWIIFGALIGFITKKITHSTMDGFSMVLVGIVGSALGGFIANALGWRPVSGSIFDIRSIILSVVGAILLLFLLNKFVKPNNRNLPR